MRKFITAAIPIVALILFVLIMQSGSLIKKSLGKEDPIIKHIETIVAEVNNDDWDNVSFTIDELEHSWKKLLYKIQLSCERDEINNINTCIARMRGAAITEDKVNLLIEANEAKSHWDRIGE